MAEPARVGPIEKFEARARRSFLRPRMALAAMAGALVALSQAPFNLWPLGLLGLAGLYTLFRSARGAGAAFWIGWAGGTGHFALALFWIVEPFFVDIARHGWMAPFALVFLAGGLALFWGAGAALAARLGGGALAFIVALSAAEMARAYVLTGFPWSLIGYVWAASPAAQWAALIGPHGLSIAALAAGVALHALASARWRRALLPAALFGLALAAAVPLGRTVPPAADAPVIRLVQPNAPQHEKWDPAHVLSFYERQLAFSAAPPEGRPPDLVVWPETAIPWLLSNAAQPLRDIGTAAGAPVVLGLRRREGTRLFNSLAVVAPAGAVLGLYDKHHLVPFGEYIPFGDLAARFGIHGLAAGEGDGFSPGPGPRLIELPGIGPALPLICYEAVFPQDVNAAPARPRLLLQITNDAWFGRFSGPYQHLQQARMRAIEQGLPMLRVANTGISAVIGPHGHVQRRIPLGVAGHVDAALPPPRAPTPYARSGDLPVAAMLVIALGLLGLRRRRLAAPGAARSFSD